jgi:thiol-disulfide isomerase/thioredoxin
MKYDKTLATLFLTGILLVSGCTLDDEENSTPTPTEQTTTTPTEQTTTAQIIGSTTIVTTSGETINVNRTAGGLIFEGYEGKIVLLEIYGHSCPFCIDAISGYNRLQANYPNDVYIITLESYGQLNNAALQQYVIDNGMQYDTVAMENSGTMFSFIQDMTGYTTNQGVPALLVLSRDGNLAEYLPPQVLNESYVDGLIQGLL